MRPSTAASSSITPSRAGATASAGVRWRPQSAGETAGGGNSSSPLNRSRSPSTTGGNASKSSASDKANPSSDQLIRDLEQKVRKVVEKKRAESDKLRFAVAKKRDDVEKAKRILQDLLKDSDALGLHYDLSEIGVDGPPDKLQPHPIPTPTRQATLCEEDATRLQPVASISRRPVYSKHTNIHELETKLERCAREAQAVQRRTLVLDHIKKRLLTERVEVAQSTKQLKHVFAELTHETHELQKREIAAAEAVSHVQLQLTQQKQDMAASVANFKCELALRQKWAREKKKFEKYYNDQLQAVAVKAAQVAAVASASTPGVTNVAGHHNQLHTSGMDSTRNVPTASPMLRRGSSSPLGILKHYRHNSSAGSSALLQPSMVVSSEEEAIERAYRDAFRRIGVDTQDEGIDPEEIIRICMSHEELRKELDAKHDEAVDRIATLRDQINTARSAAREDVPLSKRGTSQKIETKQLEISTVERRLATVVDQYMFVEHAVRPIKIGLQQVLQNVSSATVNIDNMAALENCLVDSCEEMMRMLRVSSEPLSAATNDSHSNQSEDGKTTSTGDVSSIPEEDDERTNQHSQSTEMTTGMSTSHGVVSSLDSFTSPYNVRIAAKKRDEYYVPGLVRRSVVLRKADDDEELDEDAFEVMDRAMVKRVSSVVVCTSATKKSKENLGEGIH